MKNIIFDIGGVIVKYNPISILEKLNLTENEYKEIKKFFEDWNKLDLGMQTIEEKFLECNFSDDICLKYKDILIEYYKLRDINEDVINLINLLKRNNYNIYVLSDNNKASSNYHMHHPLLSNVDEWMFSCDYQTTKAEEKLFGIFLDKYNLNPKECYFIDDCEENIRIASKYGITGYTFDGNVDNLYKDMKEKNILI